MSKHSSFHHNEGFSSSLGAILALIGSAVGLGNLWRFPYLMGTNGGSAFILIYIAFVAMLSVPIMIAEFTIGRHSRANCFRAMKVIVTYLSEEFQMKRKKAILLSTCVFMVLSMLCSLSMGPLKDFKILGYDLFSLFDAVTANFLTPIGAILIVVFLAWRMPKKDVFEEFSGSGKSFKTLYEIIYFIIKYVAPCTIAIIMICGWLGI